jgi:Bax protein
MPNTRLLALSLLCLLALAACGGKSGESLYLEYREANLQNLEYVDETGTIIHWPLDESDYSEVPDFAAINHIPDRKRAFFEFIGPAAESQNQVVEERRLIMGGIELKLEYELPLSPDDEIFLESMSQRYRIDRETSNLETVALLDRRMDVVPVSMVLTQAALESAWGTSRFAQEGNNLFGQWCFEKGCGLVPLRRNESAKHEVAKFDRVDLAVRSYFRNINTQSSYSGLRDVRQGARIEGRQPTGHELAGGLEKYSARGEDYVDELRSMIRSNQLE